MKRSMTLVLVIAAATLAIRAQDSPPREISVTAKRFEFTPSR